MLFRSIANFLLELRTEADLEITSPDEVDTKTYKQGANYKDVTFSQTFQIRNVLTSPTDKNTAKVHNCWLNYMSERSQGSARGGTCPPLAVAVDKYTM